MMGFMSPNVPAPPPIPTPPPMANPPQMADTRVAASAANAAKKARQAAGAGLADTVKTSPEGLLTPVPTAKASLLGG